MFGINSSGQADLKDKIDYYPFGMVMPNNGSNSNGNKYLYNGKELQEELGQYDYGARFYDPVVARWTTVDPSAERDGSFSPYIYAFNNPIRFTDPDGRWPDEGEGNGLSVVENVYLETRDNIASAISTGISFVKSVATGSTFQEGTMTYSNGQASMTMTDVPRGSTAGALANATLNVIGSIPGGGPTGGLMAKAPGVLNSVVDVAKDLKAYAVGKFSDLKAQSVVGDGLDVHHVAQSKPAGQVIPGYDRNTAPSIALPRGEHASIPTRKGNYQGTARSQLAKDIKDLRKHTNAPNSSLQNLIKLNKETYPGVF